MPDQVSFTINELTQGTVHGTGVFDVLMQAVKSHLKGEFEAGRIRGTDYANAMAISIGQVLSESTQYATQRAKLEVELKILDAQLLDIKAGTKIKDVEFDIQEFNRDFKLPKELELMEKDLLLKENQLELGNKELLVKQSQIELATKELLVKQNQIDLGIKELVIKEAQLGIAQKELLIKAEQLLITKYELQYKLPADVGLILAQDELYTQKTVTEKAQTDKSVVGAGSVIDTNNKLLEEQSKVYLRNAQQTAAKLLIDTWNVRHSSDPEGNLENAANKLQDADIGAAITRMNGNLS